MWKRPVYCGTWVRVWPSNDLPSHYSLCVIIRPAADLRLPISSGLHLSPPPFSASHPFRPHSWLMRCPSRVTVNRRSSPFRQSINPNSAVIAIARRHSNTLTTPRHRPLLSHALSPPPPPSSLVALPQIRLLNKGGVWMRGGCVIGP
jgi:hypothetical protein